jgi:prolyl oligopeptidase
MYRHSSIGAALLAMATLTGPILWAAEPLKYPMTRRIDHQDIYHGVKVADPYRWLEEDVRNAKDVQEWVDEENKLTSAYLKAIPQREAIRRRLTELWNYERFSVPFKAGGRYFLRHNNGLENQSVLQVQDQLGGELRVLLDPNAWTKDGTQALADLAVSDDGKYLVYGVAEAGSDWETWHVKDIVTGKLIGDELKWIKSSSAAWTNDGKGFFYTRFDEPRKGAEFQDINENNKMYYHRLGTPQADDVLVYRRPDHPDWDFSNVVSEDGRYLVIATFKGTDNKNRVSWKDLQEPYGTVNDLIDDFRNEYSFLGNDGPVFFFKTDLDAPRGRVVAIDIRAPLPPTHPKEKTEGSSSPPHEKGGPAAVPALKEVIPQAKESLTGASIIDNRFVCTYLKDARTVVKLFSLDGKFLNEINLPGIGTATGFGGRRTDTETFYSFSSYAVPPSIYRYDFVTGESKLLYQAKVKFKPEEYETRQVFYASKDGTKVPMFITHRKGLKLDGTNPTLLYGYGGFAISITPAFSIANLDWMEMGGVYAVPNLRGGAEYGEDWHQGGTKLKKQNVFDDFIAAAEWLIDNKYTSSAKLAISGASNGGLLIGACLTQRPDLYGACLPAVGVMDMLRFQKFTSGRYWVDDFGSSDNAEEFKALRAYSPYHNLKKGTKYPATLITTADTDDRVVPGHSFKFAAELQYCQGGSAPVLIRIETRAGHGAGKPTSKIIEEVADEWAFLVKNLKMN